MIHNQCKLVHHFIFLLWLLNQCVFLEYSKCHKAHMTARCLELKSSVENVQLIEIIWRDTSCCKRLVLNDHISTNISTNTSLTTHILHVSTPFSAILRMASCYLSRELNRLLQMQSSSQDANVVRVRSQEHDGTLLGATWPKPPCITPQTAWLMKNKITSQAAKPTTGVCWC